MKHKKNLTAVITSLSLMSSLAITTTNVNASWNYNEESWDGTGAVITKQKITIIKKNAAGKYSKSYRTKTLNANTKLKVYPDGYHKNWILFKKGYAHKGYIPDGNKSQPKKGYYWIIKKNWLNDSWFKMDPNPKLDWNYWQKPRTVKITKDVNTIKYYSISSDNSLTDIKTKSFKKGTDVKVWHKNSWVPNWYITLDGKTDPLTSWKVTEYSINNKDKIINSKATNHDWFKEIK